MSVHKNVYFINGVGWWIKGVSWPPTANDIANLQASDPHQRSEAHEAKPSKPGTRQTVEKKELFEKVRSILRDRTEPMRFPELFARVKESGLRIGGIDEKRNFATFLNKFPCFETGGRTSGWRYRPDRDFEILLQAVEDNAKAWDADD
jgi:hypothetical protein